MLATFNPDQPDDVLYRIFLDSSKDLPNPIRVLLGDPNAVVVGRVDARPAVSPHRIGLPLGTVSSPFFKRSLERMSASVEKYAL